MMPDTTSIEINAKDQNDKSVKTTISYVNPNAQPSVLKLFGQKLTNLTNNIYESTTRVDKTNVDTATDKKTQVITLQYSTSGSPDTNLVDVPDSGELPASAIVNSKAGFRFLLPIDEDALPTQVVTGGTWRFKQYVATLQSQNLWAKFEITFDSDITFPYTCSIALTTAETPTYAAFEKTWNLTFVEGGE